MIDCCRTLVLENFNLFGLRVVDFVGLDNNKLQNVGALLPLSRHIQNHLEDGCIFSRIKIQVQTLKYFINSFRGENSRVML